MYTAGSSVWMAYRKLSTEGAARTVDGRLFYTKMCIAYLVEDAEMLLSVKFCWSQFHSAVPEVKSKMSQPIKGQDDHLGFPISAENTN